MEQTEAQSEANQTSGETGGNGQDPAQTEEARAHGYDASKYERPSVTVDVVMMSLRQRDLQVLLIKRRSQSINGHVIDRERIAGCWQHHSPGGS